ncbi:MAG: hypothetical protein BGN87_18515 [Rhizobiales bacterium 65-79]|nr:hypothetical protein [Hyphomicrobiales bacterium]OJU03598.1 MAG: hypothetical protein BGN87_18515 [Rhizobiales bacterium 65-79]
MSDIENVLREALRSVRVSYRPGLGAYETASSEEIIAGGWRGEYQWPVRRDPIFTPLFTAIFGTGGFTLFGSTISYAAIASAIATTAITAGLQYLLAPKPPKPEDGRQPLTQPIPFRFWGVGRVRVAGAFMLWEAKDDFLISVQAIAGHRVNAFVGYYLNDDLVTLTDNVVDPVGKRYENNVSIWSRLGAVPETPYSDVVAKLSSTGIWTDNHRGDGQASVAMIAQSTGAKRQNKLFPYGRPVLSVVVEMALVWDFRDPDQDPEDESTWAYSKNSALILCWHECFNPFGTKRDYKRAILPVLDMWQEEADVCDENVALAIGGTEKRYECSGFDTTEHDPKSGTNAILASCDGWMCERGDGALLFVSGKFREKYIATVSDADIVGHHLQYDVLPEEEVNRLVPKFTYPATDYTTTDTDFFEDPAAQILAGRVLSQEANYPWVQQWRQARRLGKREWLRLQAKKRGSLDLRLTAINAVYAPWVRLSTPNRIPALDGKVVANRKSTLALTKGGFEITFIQMPDNPATIDSWDPEVEEGAAPPVPLQPESEGIPSPDIDTIVVISSGGAVYLRLSLVDYQRDDVYPVVRYRLADDGTGNPGAWAPEQTFPDADAVAGLVVVNTNPVPADELLQVEAALIGSDGTYGEWSLQEEITSTA